MTDPYTDLEINCRSQLSILEACRHENPERQGSSSRARARSTAARGSLPVDESHPIAPVDVNGINKTAGEWYHLLYGDVYGIRTSRAAAHEHLRAADARARRPADVPRHLDPARARRRGDPRSSATAASGATSPTSTTRRAPSCSRPARRRRRAGSTTSAATVTSPCSSSARLLTADRGQRPDPARPLPRRPEGDRHRRLLRRLLGDRARARLGPVVGLEEGLARTLEYYREHGDAYWGGRVRVPFLDLTRETAALREELDAAIARVLDSGRYVLGRGGRPRSRRRSRGLRRRARRRGRVGDGRDHDRAARGRRRARRRGDHGARTRASRRSSGSSAPARRRCSPTSTRRPTRSTRPRSSAA